jgi:hypothetical protein
MIGRLKERWLYYTGGMAVLLILLYMAQGRGDFYVFISASKDLLLKKNIYQIMHNEGCHYYYDVLFALILVPFSYMPFYIAKLIWLIINVFFFYRIWIIINGWLPISNLNNKRRTIFYILAFIFILSFLRDNFQGGQVTILLLYLILEGLNLIRTNKKIAGSILIGLGINIKLLPIVMIPYLIYRKEWKAAIFTIVFVVVFLFIPMIFIGKENNNMLLKERWQLINPVNPEHIRETAQRGYHSVSALLTSLLTEDTSKWGSLRIKSNFTDISVEKLHVLINIARAILILSVLYFLRTLPFKRADERIQILYEVSYLSLIIPLIFPHQQQYSFLFIFPASTYLLFYLVYLYGDRNEEMKEKNYKRKKISIIILLSIIFFLTSSHFILGVFNEFYDRFKTLTYGVLLLGILLAVCRPDKIIMKSEELRTKN